MCGAGGNVNEFSVGVCLFVHSCDVHRSLNHCEVCEGSSTATPASKNSVKDFVTF